MNRFLARARLAALLLLLLPLAGSCLAPAPRARVTAPAELPPEPPARESSRSLGELLPFQVGWRHEYSLGGEAARGTGLGTRRIDERVTRGSDGSPLVERRLGPELPWDNLACVMDANRRGCEDDVVSAPLRVGATFRTPIGDQGRIADVDAQVDTPAGRQAGCLVVDYTRPRAALAFVRVYFAPGIGMVKIEWRRAPGHPEATRWQVLERRVQERDSATPARRR